MLAQTHAASIERYVAHNLKAFNSHVSSIVAAGTGEPEYENGFQDDLGPVFVINAAPGSQADFPERAFDQNGSRIVASQSEGLPSAANINVLIEKAKTPGSHISNIMKLANGGNTFYLFRKIGNVLYAAPMATTFLTELAGNTRFGYSGHAAIFDGVGNLIAHPDKAWQETARNIAELAPVSLATTGGYGVVEFYSSNSNSQMLAGVSGIGLTQWGIMVPRSVDEIAAEAGIARQSISILFTLILAAILLGVIMASNIISKPLEKLTKVLRRVTSNGNLDDIEFTQSKFAPLENAELESSFSQMAENLRSTHNQMKLQVYTDIVTKLPNREGLGKILEKSLADMANREKCGSFLFIDIHNFKEINDNHGHSFGDQILRCIGARINSIVEITTGSQTQKVIEESSLKKGQMQPVFARFGGYEFVAFIPDDLDPVVINELAAKILEAIRLPVPGMDSSIILEGHIGIARFPEHGLTFEELLKKADIAVFHAKKEGKNCIKRYGDGTGEMSSSEIRRDVLAGIKNNQMELYYQPKVTSRSGKVNSVEALIRWFHPARGMISPSDFIPAIEGSDITNELGEWVIRRACQDMKAWDKAGVTLDISVNIAARQFSSVDFVDRLHAIVMEENCKAERLEIEVTEETALSGEDTATDVIGKLHSLGYKVSLDDYGRGYSNLTRLSDLRVNTLKIDGPLTARITRDERTRVIFEATINMANGLNCKTVAEGVETAEEVAILSKLGCTELQGFYFATPMPQKSILNWIQNRKRNPVRELHERLRSAV